MSKRLLSMAVLALLLATVAGMVNAQDGGATNDNGDPVVYAVFFYSPSCPHCHDVVDNHFPVLEEEFGEQLVIIPVNVTLQGAGQYVLAACDTYGVPEDRCGSVPMMVLGESEVMIGSVDIPTRMPGLVRAGLSAGGIPVPAFIRADYEAAVAAAEEEAGGTDGGETGEAGAAAPVADDTGDDGSGSGGNVAGFEGGDITASVSVADRLAADPAGNAVAIGVLVALVASLIAVVVQGRAGQLATGQLAKIAARVAVVASLLAAVTLIVGPDDEATANTLALLAVGLLVISVYFLMLPIQRRRDLRAFAVPAVALAGLAVAVYLAQVETGGTTAVCGAIGDCNTVQQSAYATLFGVLPVGVLGIIGYVAMLGTWLLTVLPATAAYAPLARAALFGMALFGVAFSAYLTFLEPFVIGASCMWCITSALTMLALLWMTAPAGWQAATEVIVDGRDDSSHASSQAT